MAGRIERRFQSVMLGQMERWSRPKGWTAAYVEQDFGILSSASPTECAYLALSR